MRPELLLMSLSTPSGSITGLETPAPGLPSPDQTHAAASPVPQSLLLRLSRLYLSDAAICLSSATIIFLARYSRLWPWNLMITFLATKGHEPSFWLI